MNGLTATGVTVGICAGLWQLVSSHVGLSQGWELLGTIGFVAFCSFYAAGGGVQRHHTRGQQSAADNIGKPVHTGQ